MGGAAPYWQSYTYDTTGNRKTETQHATAGDTTRTYTYPAAGQPQPHTLRSVATTAPSGSQTDSYTYGPGGHTTGRTVAGSAETLDWNLEGQLASVTEGSETTGFVYDADGNRLIRREPAATTLYLPGGSEVKADNTTGTKTGTRYYTHLGETIAVRTQTALTWLAPDHHNTADVAISSTTRAATYRRMTPFGAPRGTPVPWQGDRGFVNGTIDSTTGLTHLGAREYDTSTGRFTSVDPLVDPNDPQTLNAYAYANNNPTTHADPTGKAITLDAYGHYHVPSTKPKHRNRAKVVERRHRESQRARERKRVTVARPVPGANTACDFVGPCARPHGFEARKYGWPNWQSYAHWVVKIATDVGIDPRLLLATLRIESDTCQKIGDLCRSMWREQLGWKNQGHDPSIGVANMHRDVFNRLKALHPEVFSGRDFEEMVDDDTLAITAMAYQLRNVQNSLPEQEGRGRRYTRDELTDFGYRGTREAVMSVAGGRKDMSAHGQEHLNRFRSYYADADKLICHSGYWSCK